MRHIFLGALAALVLGDVQASAETCGGIYKIKRGDTLSGIADRQYKDARKWSAIYNANVERIGESPNRVNAGMKLNLPCINGLPTGLEGGEEIANATLVAPAVTKVVKEARVQRGPALRVRLLTAGDYAPFTDKNALNGGLITEIVDAAMVSATGNEGYDIHWVNDWAAHLDPLLTYSMLDMGFPWFQPDCKQNPDRYRCANFHFSEPMFEMLILLFTDRNRPLNFTQDSDIEGKTLCRPKGYFTHDLDKNGRNWVRDNKITLETPVAVADCFEMRTEGKVDAVALNEFTGRKAVKDLELSNRVDIVQSRPLSIEGLHVLVHKTHPDAEQMLSTINDGLGKIKSNGVYQQIIDKHMSIIWSDL